MSNYIIYNNEGDIIQQGNALDENIQIIKLTLNNSKLLIVPEKLSNSDDYRVIDGVVCSRETPLEVNLHYSFARNQTYNLGEQLDLLYKDIRDGLLGEAAKTGKFYTYITEIKQRYPKE